nr:MAG TPA: hypothetical protein [Ackermannviridae sp.]
MLFYIIRCVLLAFFTIFPHKTTLLFFSLFYTIVFIATNSILHKNCYQCLFTFTIVIHCYQCHNTTISKANNETTTEETKMTGLREYLENLTDDVFEQDEIESHLMDTDFDKYAELLAVDLLSEGLRSTDFEKICARTYGYSYTAERVVSKMQEMGF